VLVRHARLTSETTHHSADRGPKLLGDRLRTRKISHIRNNTAWLHSLAAKVALTVQLNIFQSR
jgi:hypothetical protein